MKDRFVVSIDLGGTNTKIALVDSAFSIQQKISFSTKNFFSHRDILISEIVKNVTMLLQQHAMTSRHLKGVGIGVPGLVNFKKGSVYYLPNVPRWKDTPLRSILERKLQCRVFVDNDVNLMALAESRLGAAKGFKNVLCVTLGTGVGGGLILDGRLFRGSSFCAGEFGHMPISVGGKRCGCGGKGCLETYVGNKVILNQARRKLRKKGITLEALSELARKGNKAALEVYKDFAEKIGIALSGVTNLLNPEIIVVGGGLSFAGEFIFKTMKQTIQDRSMPVQAKAVSIKHARLGNDAGLIGAALLVYEQR